MARKPFGNQRFFSFFIIYNRFSGYNIRSDHDIITIFISAKKQCMGFAMAYSLFFWIAGSARLK